jgi:hypothetical protein
MYANLEINNTLYVFMHAEQVYRGMESFGTCSSIGGNTIEDIYRNICNSIVKSIVIDFDRIITEKNGVQPMEHIIKHCKENNIYLTLCRVNKGPSGKGLSEELKLNGVLKKYYDTDFREKQIGVESYNYICSDSPINSITDKDIYSLYEKKLIERMVDSSSKYIDDRSDEPDNQYSHSSNVNLPKYINLKAFIEEKEISFLGLYLLYKKAIQSGLFKDENPPLLFFSSMAGSYLASIISKLANVDMVFLNHLGPKQKLYRELHKEQMLADRDYLIISDVVCLGSEIERAKTLIEHAGGKLIGILSVVSVEVVANCLDKNTISLLTLTKDNNTTIEYQIITDFPEIKN